MNQDHEFGSLAIDGNSSSFLLRGTALSDDVRHI